MRKKFTLCSFPEFWVFLVAAIVATVLVILFCIDPTRAADRVVYISDDEDDRKPIVLAEDGTEESIWTDQPQFLENTLRGTLLFAIDGQPYILLNGLKRGGKFQEFFFASFPEELFEEGISQYILGRKVFFTIFQGYIDSWGFADEGVRQRVDRFFMDLYGE